MAHGWNPYMPNFSSFPVDHGAPDSEVSHHHQTDDFIGHGEFSSASTSHGASAANANYCFGHGSSNGTSESENSQRKYREVRWQPDGETKPYLPRWDNSSNFEAAAVETTEHCLSTPQLEHKQDSVVPKGSQYFENYHNIQGPSDGIGEQRSSCEYLTSASENNIHTGATARYHPQWVQTHNENVSPDCAYSNMWPNLTAKHETTCDQNKRKSFEHHGISFPNSNTYADSDTQRAGNIDQTSRQTPVKIPQDANLSENDSDMDAKDISEANEGNNLGLANKAFTDDNGSNTQTSNSCQNKKDDEQHGPSHSSSQATVVNDSIHSDVTLTDASEASNDNSLNGDDNFAKAADRSSLSQPSPTGIDANLSDSHLCPESDSSLTETVEQVASSKAASLSTLDSSDDPCHSVSMNDMDNKTVTPMENKDTCDVVCTDNKTTERDLLDLANQVTINRINESNSLDSLTNIAFNKTDDNACAIVTSSKDKKDHDTVEMEQLCPEEKVPDSDCKMNSSDNIHGLTKDSNNTIVVVDSEQRRMEDRKHKNEQTTTLLSTSVACSDQIDDNNLETEQNALSHIMDIEPELLKNPEEKMEQKFTENYSTSSVEKVKNIVENISCLETQIPEDASPMEISKLSDVEHLLLEDFGKPLTPPTCETDEKPTAMKPSTKMLKRLQPIVLIKTSDLMHLNGGKYVCAQCMHSTSTVDDLIEHHSLQHPRQNFQSCTPCGVYSVHDRKHVCHQERIVASSKRGRKAKRQKQYCNICEIRFLKWNVFVSHMRTHTGVTPYKCEKCQLYFAQNSTLRRHKRIPGRCRGLLTKKCVPQKPRNQSVKSMFSCYVKLYDVTKSHFCKFCGKCFKTSSHVNKHFHNVHKKQLDSKKQVNVTKQIKETSEITPEKRKHKCPLCTMTFSHYLNRNHHLKDCLKDGVFGKRNRVGARYKCPLCLASFTLASNRYRHIFSLCLRNFLSYLGKDISLPIKFPRYSKNMKTILNKLKTEEEQLNGQDATGHRVKYNHSADEAVCPVSDTEDLQKKNTDSVKCKYCDKSFGSSQALKMHQFTHQGERPYYCSQCGKGFKSHVVLTQHKITHQRRIQCTVCKKILPTIGELIQHRTSHPNRGMLQCPDCPRQFTFPVFLVRHLRTHLKNQNKFVHQDQTVNEKDSLSQILGTQNRCQLCDDFFYDTKLLKKHYLTHISISSSPQCPFCKSKFTNRRYLLRHLARHVGDKRLSKEIDLKSQSNICQSKTVAPETFVCRHCSRPFTRKGHLMRHYMGHNKKSLSRCNTCSFYYGLSKMSKHKKMCNNLTTDSPSQTVNKPSDRTVSSENKYQCQHCSHSFKYVSLYNRHLLTHKGLELHPCILCGQNFPTLALCSQHEASCNGLYKCKEPVIRKKVETVIQRGAHEFKCKFCNKKFTKSRSLRRHILTHNEVKPYRCKACDSCFSRYDHLKVHSGRCIGKEKLQLRPQICIPKISLDQVGIGWQKELQHEKEMKNKTLECKICARTFATQSKLNWHNSMFHTVKRFKCMQCSSFFSHEKSLRDHVKYRKCRLTTIVKSKTLLQQTQITKVSSEKQNVLLSRILPPSTDIQSAIKTKCHFCLRTFRTSAHLKVHLLLHCEKSFACECGKKFKKKMSLLRHTPMCATKQNQSSSHGFSCAYCSSRFLLFSQLQEHFLDAHKMETMDEPVETAPLQQHLSNIQHFEEKPDISELSQISKFNRPFEDKNPQTDSRLRNCPYPCKICKKGFWNKTLLRNHFRKCQRNVSSGAQLMEDDDVPLRADIDMVLTDSDAENSPEEVEDSEPQIQSLQEKKTAVYQCSECDKSFTDGLLLISHLEAHGREEQEKRLNKCTTCGRTFLNQARLEKHMKIHDMFICKDCSAEFLSQTELDDHRKKLHDPSLPYSCRSCHYRFKNRTILADHCTKNHPDDIFSCHLCNLNYTLRTSLIRHNKKYHRHVQNEPAEKTVSTKSSSDGEAAAAYNNTDDAADADNDDDDDDDDGGCDDNSDYDNDGNGESDSADSDSVPYFPCHVCGKTFTTSESLEDHQRCHLGEKPYECAQCGQCFFQAGQLQQHERKHKSEFQCRICGRGFVSLFALRKHKHTSGKKRPYRCKRCPLYFTNFALLGEHMVCHREESFPCDICNRKFPSKSSRAEHRKIHLPKSSATELSDQSAVKTDNKPASLSRTATNELKYRCGVCCVRFRNPEELSEHGCLAGLERQYSCLECDKHFLHSSHLKKHLTTHKQPSSQNKYPCNQCNNHFSSPHGFLNHLRNHDENENSSKGFICPICHQWFSSPAELVFHFPSHPSTPFQCKNCNQTFPSVAELKEHEVCHSIKATQCKKCGQDTQGAYHECTQRQINLMNIVSSFADDDEIDVTGDDLCFCPFCPMQFSSRSNLLEHQNREHPNEKTFTCEICARTYAKQKYLDKHMKKHQSDTAQSTSQIKFQCAQCHSEFHTAKDLSLHLKLHAAEKEVGEYRCDMCYKSFGQLNLLRRHQESHVGQVVYECTECDKAFAFPHLLEEHQKSHV